VKNKKKDMRKAIIFALAFLLLLPLVKADTYITDCAELNVTGETYYLTQDIINSTNSTCMNISANNVIFDCQGHTIDGAEDGIGIQIYRNPPVTTNVTIKNCALSDWKDAIWTDMADYNNFINITTNSNTRYGFYIMDSTYNYFINITANFNADVGMRFVGDYTYHQLSNIFAYGNGWYGLALESSHNTVDNITSIGSNWGIYISDINNTIKNSKVQNSGEYGIRIFTGSKNNTFYNNLFNNTINIYFDEVYNNTWNTTKQTGTRIYSNGTEIGGNYWTNPTATGYSDTCTDADKDGFCDDPYVLATDNVDYLALSDEYVTPPLVTGVPLLSRTLVGIAIGFGVLAFMLKTLFDIREPKKVVEYFIALAVIVLTVIALIVLFA
jgi:hypothetical protein